MTETESSDLISSSVSSRNRTSVLWIIPLLLILVVGAYFRFVGLNWDESQHLHPDERFLTMVSSAISPVSSFGAYFNTAESTLNPHNQGYSFYVYGTLPLFMTRYLAEALNQSGYDQVYLVGRAVSASLDILTILLVYLIALRMFGSRRLALLAAAFDALSVLPIQLSHFYTVDIPANFFIFLAFYIAVRIQTAPERDPENEGEGISWKRHLMTGWSGAVPYALFGIASGMALASKISAAPLVLLLPGAAWLWMLKLRAERQKVEWPSILRNLVVGGFFALLSFRVFQPYAFSGPGFFGLLPNEKWIKNLQELAAQTGGDVDVPFALQWARRPITFAWQNMVEWGMGLPLGLLAWAGFLWMGWRMVRGEWRRYLILWGWTGAFFAWQSLQGNPSMRYQIPVYPTLAIIAAWMLVELWHTKLRPTLAERMRWIADLLPWPKVVAVGLGGFVLVSTFAWAIAFSQIYLRPVTRVEATRWIYQNVPGPINIQYQTANGSENQPLSIPYDTLIEPGKPYSAILSVPSESAVVEIQLPSIRISTLDADPVRLQATITDIGQANQPVGRGQITLPFSTEDKPYNIPLDEILVLKPGVQYGLILDLVAKQSSLNITAPIQLSAYRTFWLDSIAASNQELAPGKPLSLIFKPGRDGKIQQVRLPLSIPKGNFGSQAFFSVAVFAKQDLNSLVGSSSTPVALTQEQGQVTVSFDPPVEVSAAKEYVFAVDLSGVPLALNVDGLVQLSSLEQGYDVVLPYPVLLLNQGQAYLNQFTAITSGTVNEIYLPYAVQQDPSVSGMGQVTIMLADSMDASVGLAQGVIQADLTPKANLSGVPLTFKFVTPAALEKGKTYFVKVQLETPGRLGLRGSSPANETAWDDGLPLRMDGFDAYGGIYQRDLRLELYWDDNADKVRRFNNILDQSDYLFITSNRQWGPLTRLQERFPLTTAYYRRLLGCPPEKEVFWCYAVAEPGMFTPGLGYELVKTFQSDPNLGPLKFNSQFAEEAFTVYDAPKVMIFRKTATYSSAQVATFLSSVNIAEEVHVTPKKAPSYQANLELPDYRLAQQQEGGTWSDLFNLDALYNRFPALALVLWYLAIGLLGLTVYPVTRLVMGRLADRGYPVARTVGMVLLAYLVWMGSSNGIPFTNLFIWLAFAVLLVVNAGLFYVQRDEIRQEWRQNRRYFIMVELVTLAFFALDLAIRFGNPDLWHPGKGGEKPMDFSYLNAVLKSTSFPPYDPWYAGGYINYYYYGFVLVGVLIKGLGIVPSIAYNLFLPSLFAMVAMGAFSLGWNLLGPGWKKPVEDDAESSLKDPPQPVTFWGLPRLPFLAGLSSAFAVLILGNWGTVKMIWEGFQRLVVAPDVMDSANFFTRMGYMFQGMAIYLNGSPLPYPNGDWYWNPSRAIPGNTITEFPFFTFLYGDPHAHLIALPLTLLALVWSLSILRTRWEWGQGDGVWRAGLRFAASLVLGALIIGALRPTNTWDMPAYLGLGALAIFYTAVKYGRVGEGTILDGLGSLGKRILLAGVSTVALIGLAFLLYQPFANWYAQAYNSVEPWVNERSPMWGYTMHWGVFLFIIASWFVRETIDWMAATPVSRLNQLRPFKYWIIGGLLVFLAALVLFQSSVEIAWIPIVMGIWAAVLLFRPGQPDSKRAVLVMTGLALMLTLVVEVIVLKGDIGRMNTIFKFYLQAWTLLGVSAAAALWWILSSVAIAAVSVQWRNAWWVSWKVAVGVLVFGAALFPIFGGLDKIRDRMTSTAPHTLDGMEYMQTSTYADKDVDMSLGQDYEAIRWMQQNVKGSPVIVEAHNTEYRWGTRFTIYTGLPGVVGWNWHQRQQRAANSDQWVFARVDAVNAFYNTPDIRAAVQFLNQYNVKYIILGQLENAYYPGPGLAKFADQNGKLWREVYHKDSTIIYEVIK
jgi:YYY domain-containing protein